MGAVVNMRPDLFNAVIMGVPFVDVLTTMADETIPLTNIEWEEWGNPAVSPCMIHTGYNQGHLAIYHRPCTYTSAVAPACMAPTQLLFQVRLLCDSDGSGHQHTYVIIHATSSASKQMCATAE